MVYRFNDPETLFCMAFLAGYAFALAGRRTPAAGRRRNAEC